ncbi:wax ester/triacylglycerol synthase domain-containing protein [uncultured Microbacterium sp.]|uniref:diacylglycerol O-acyltransferase n=1 Tax=uncultured Microbacterium sp. TaxID=191216 RepID=A0A1Y5P6V9_9MICO|nr:wax ester/triacylglycerol synthase domain-containing protein [uncultured Microbacterium sp.]SBS73250.1 Acyltransferase, WS/DGAT/MGAT [uncultured Microbacterium sp.]
MDAGTARLAAVDEANLVLDHSGQVNVFLVCATLAPGGFVAEDGAADMGALRRAVRTRIGALPALGRSIVTVGPRHRWRVAEPDLAQHIRLDPPVDGVPGLEALCAQLMCRPLPRDRPLWEILVVPMGPGEVGVVFRVHHAVADGMAAAEILHGLFDPDEHLISRAVAPSRPSTTGTETHVGALRYARRIIEGVHRVLLTGLRRAVPPTVLLGERTPHRGVAFLRVDLAPLHERAHLRGATVNDALLSAVAAGYRSALRAAGEPIPAELPVSVPVALPRRANAGNHVGVMLVRLPLHEADPETRLGLIAAQTQKLKVEARSQGTFEFMRGPIGARLFDRLARQQRLVAGFVTNVPGAAGAFQLAGAPVTALWPVGVLAGNVRLGVAAVSYNGTLACGIHFDAGTVPGVDFSRAMAAELGALEV